MNQRSRKGCIDCKRAKIKCDEAPTSCGTCLRRGYICQGYENDDKDAKSVGHTPHILPTGRQVIKKRRIGRPPLSTLHGAKTRAATSTATTKDQVLSPGSENTCNEPPPSTFAQDHNLAVVKITRLYREDAEQCQPPLYQHVPAIIAGTVPVSDQRVVEMYFQRHPKELVISPEFIGEMNSNVMQIFHHDPALVSDSLSAIGHAYLDEGGGNSVIPILHKRARILSRLRNVKGGACEMEHMLLMLLGLCALEMIDKHTLPKDSMLASLLANTAMILKHHESMGKTFSPIAKYFVRALARQDMMLALTLARPPYIPTSIWLDNYSMSHADRFMGYIGSLMPLLCQLCKLAEEISLKAKLGVKSPFASVTQTSSSALGPGLHDTNDTVHKATILRESIANWRPNINDVNFQTSKGLLYHAYAYQSAALLHLYRLLEPAGASKHADSLGLSMAHEVLMHLNGLNKDIKTCLWPVLISACELANSQDRASAVEMFDAIYEQRRTVTSLRTKEFCTNRVWRARDAGEQWNWMALAKQYPNECIPI